MDSIEKKRALLACSRGDVPADLVLKNGKIINTFTDSITEGDVAIFGDRIAGIGKYEGIQEIDLAGCYLCPGFIDGHIHIESSMLSPQQFARAVVPHGTSCVICDPHEIANVAGLEGVFGILDSSLDLPISIFAMAPSCVPATSMETSGGIFGPEEIDTLLQHPLVIGLAEMMNFPGTVHADTGVLAILAKAQQKKCIIDGHAPGLSGHALQAYIAAGVSSDHECTDYAEALEKLQSGMYIYIREGSTAQNLAQLLPIVNKSTAGRCMLVSDDRHPDDLLHKGHLDNIIRKAVKLGLDPLLAIKMATLSPSMRFGLSDRGAIAPGYRADMICFEDLSSLQVTQVYHGGRIVAEKGSFLPFQNLQNQTGKLDRLTSSVNINWDTADLTVPAKKDGLLRVIEIVPNQIITQQKLVVPEIKDGMVVTDSNRDLCKLAVFERHKASGNIGVGFVQGFGIKNGAIASTVAHDSHNLIAVGTSDENILIAARALQDLQGGLVVVKNNAVLASLQLEVGGLMSNRMVEDICSDLGKLHAAIKEICCTLDNPFMQLSFLALPVIPDLKLTDKGLIDVTAFSPVSIWQ